MARDPERIHRICSALEQRWLAEPDSRFFQLLTSVELLDFLNVSEGSITTAHDDNVQMLDPYYTEDDTVEAKLKGV